MGEIIRFPIEKRQKIKFDLNDFKKGNYAMHCDTEEKARKYFAFRNIDWKNNRKWWVILREELCVDVHKPECGTRAEYDDYIILEYDDFDWEAEKR